MEDKKSQTCCAQKQLLKKKHCQDQMMKQIMVTELHGRLFGQIEEVFVKLDYPIERKYNKYVPVEPKDLTGALMNIEIFVMTLDFFHSQVDEETGQPKYKFPKNSEDSVMYWSKTIEDIKKKEDLSNEIKTSLEVLQVVLAGLKEQKVKELEKDLSEDILDYKSRDAMAEDMVRNQQTKVIHMANYSQDVTQAVDKQLEQIIQDPATGNLDEITPEPRIDTNFMQPQQLEPPKDRHN